MGTFRDFEAPVFKNLTSAIRALAMDAVQKANSGHPGMPMGMAEIAEVLWIHHLRHNPANPKWADRDRFVLSNGHGSMLIYALLHLTGYDLPLEEIKRFRQLHSKTPGHPEHGLTPGVETTTGPLGQGLANGVGMALAGTLKLGKLMVIYDDNGISIDGATRGWFTDDTCKRFEAYGWNVICNVDGNDVEAVDAAIRKAQAVTDRPSFIDCKTVIAKGAPHKSGTAEAHGAPLGEKEVAETRVALHWLYPPFEIPESIYAGWNARDRGAAAEDEWAKR